MRTVDIDQAQAQFSELLAEAEAGEEIVIARGGCLVVSIVRYTPDARPIRVDDGRLQISEDFDTWLPREFEPYR